MTVPALDAMVVLLAGTVPAWTLEVTMLYGTIVAARTTDQPRYGLSADGYGRKIPMPYMVKLADDTTDRWRRVYAVCFSNAASFYVVRHGGTIMLSDAELEVALGR